MKQALAEWEAAWRSVSLATTPQAYLTALDRLARATFMVRLAQVCSQQQARK